MDVNFLTAFDDDDDKATPNNSWRQTFTVHDFLLFKSNFGKFHQAPTKSLSTEPGIGHRSRKFSIHRPTWFITPVLSENIFLKNTWTHREKKMNLKDNKNNKTRGQSNLTKSASRGAHSPVMGHPRGSKFVPLNSWGYGFLLVFHSNYRPRMHRLATVHERDNQPTTNDVTRQPISISASFTKVKWGA